MSTKINVRSPFYLNLTEPVPPLPQFSCDRANIQNLTIDQQGQVNSPSLNVGTVLSITSSDSDFSNDKFATETSATQRTLVVRIAIPAGYSNSADGFLDCSKTITQPALVTSGATPSCSGGPTTNSSISAKTIAVDGDSEAINLSSFFTAGATAITGFSVYVANPALVNATVSGTTLTISSNAIGGSTNVIVSASDSASNTCTASQSIAVTVSSPNQAFVCFQAAFSGGGITQAGVITKPNSVAAVGNIKASSGGSAISSHSANGTGSTRTVTLFFDLTAPAGYSNAGSTVECSTSFQQPASNPAFDCAVAGLSGQNISQKGIIDAGSISLGTISSFSPLNFATVDSSTARTVTFTINVPAGYSNSGTITCPVSITQPAKASTCGAVNYKLSGPKNSAGDFCGGLFTASQSITSTASSITTALGKTVCKSNAPFAGANFYYVVSVNQTSVGPGTGKFYLWQIDDAGIIQDVAIHDCPTGSNSGDGKGKGGSL